MAGIFSFQLIWHCHMAIVVTQYAIYMSVCLEFFQFFFCISLYMLNILHYSSKQTYSFLISPYSSLYLLPLLQPRLPSQLPLCLSHSQIRVFAHTILSLYLVPYFHWDCPNADSEICT